MCILVGGLHEFKSVSFRGAGVAVGGSGGGCEEEGDDKSAVFSLFLFDPST